jgi:hypothetical protein
VEVITTTILDMNYQNMCLTIFEVYTLLLVFASLFVKFQSLSCEISLTFSGISPTISVVFYVLTSVMFLVADAFLCNCPFTFFLLFFGYLVVIVLY